MDVDLTSQLFEVCELEVIIYSTAEFSTVMLSDEEIETILV